MLLALLLSAPAHATWSIVAADSATGEIGGAGTSCVGRLDVAVIYGSAPGHGAIHAQAALSTAGRDRGAELLEIDTAPEEIIAEITSSAFDSRAASRQYGVVDLQGRSAAWTGSSNGSWAGDVQGSVDGIAYSAQGNILTGAAVVNRTAESFGAGGACDLAGRLLEALQAGVADGEGDSRCTDRGVPADSAFIRVEDIDGNVLVDLSVTDTGTTDPIERLGEDFAVWRTTNPCPVIEDTDTDTDTPVEESGCGCATAGGSLWMLPLLALALIPQTRTPRPRPRGSHPRVVQPEQRPGS